MKLGSSLFASAALLITGAAFAQTPINNNVKLYQPDNNPQAQPNGKATGNPAAGSSFQVYYATNFNLGTEAVKVLNTGTAGGVDGSGSICVNVYVFDGSMNFQDCCYCKVSADNLGVIPLSGNFNAPSTMVIKLVATYPNDFQPNTSSTTNPNTAQPTPTTTNTCVASLPATSLDPTNVDANHQAGISQGTSFTSPGPPGQQWLAPGMAAWLDITPFQNATHPQLEFHQSSLSMGEAANLAYQCGLKHTGLGGPTPQCPASTCN